MSDNKKQNSKNIIEQIKASFTGRKFKSGAYVSVISAVVIVLILLINLIISEFDLKIDLSNNKLYTLTDETKEYIKNMEDDITIYYLVEAGNEAQIFQKIAEKFDSLSDKITLVQKDPVQYPTFAQQYVDDEISVGSFLVVNNRTNKAKYVDYNEMLVQEFDYQSFQYFTVGVDVEGKLISAIQYVTNPDLPVVYYTVGHEEYEIGELFKDTLDRMNIEIQSLQTLTLEKMPDDCDVLIINSPKIDFSDSEIDMIKQYMAAGGKAVIVMDYQAQDFVNLNSLINYYGMQIEKGIICEADADRYVPLYPRYIVPEVLEHDITNTLSKSNRIVVTPKSSGITLLDNVRSSLTIEPLLKTSDSAYSKVDLNPQTLLKEDGDIDGPFYTGVVSSDTYEGVTSKLVVYTSEMIFDDNMISDFGNFYLLVGTISNLVGEMDTISVRARYLYPQFLNITQKAAMIWAAAIVIVLPVIILASGIVIVVRRRKR
ncbi:ABC-type uncharacterized transport system involved in gliding motility auxiliary subunit [Herbinix hemicellulosilytica]|uniref:Uncharacterized protein n=1 Tax=Herbinix hemicellulosilytica TaxID=1564487 RepID=A0A0H5SDE1_HERHM|nr:GldG family protein [Herbinix hemicellulosilytica]RBP56930.1 ABC-type uncharacterized transport system involved in gliding motility auxiliary subunit [Herbinix hemicellulosilytica]CRZ33382.1 hypothetical protein HHT355_0168 [Herbinix hemicellulosilytica]